MSDYEYYDAYTGEELTEDELYTMYDNMLDECYDTVTMGDFSWEPSRVLSELDHVAYHCGYDDYVDSLLRDGSITDEPPTDDGDDS